MFRGQRPGQGPGPHNRKGESHMEQTANYHLSQWKGEERILVEDLNTGNAKVDAALKA